MPKDELERFKKRELFAQQFFAAFLRPLVRLRERPKHAADLPQRLLLALFEARMKVREFLAILLENLKCAARFFREIAEHNLRSPAYRLQLAATRFATRDRFVDVEFEIAEIAFRHQPGLVRRSGFCEQRL